MKQMTITLLRILLVLAGLYIIRLYIPPLISLGVINAGNLFGFAAGGGLILVGALLPPLTELVKTLWQKGAGKAFVCIVFAAAIAFVSVFFATLGSVIANAKTTATDETTVIVLGCQIRGSVPSNTLIARANVATEYLKEHPDAVAIASGGQGSDEDLSEGQCIYNLMTAAGIDGSRIYIEDTSVNTDANIANSKKIIEENGLSDKVAVATTDYHQKRALMICKKNGLAAASLPCASTKWAKPTFFTREVFGIWAQWILK